MTITYIGPGTTRNGRNTRGAHTYTRTFELETDSADDTTHGPYNVGSDPNLPVIGSVHPEDSAAYCYDISVDPIDDSKYGWLVTCLYSDERTLDPNDPESDEILVSCTSEVFQSPVYQDIDGNAVANSAGDYFIDPSITTDDAFLIFKIKSNHLLIPQWVITYINSVNSTDCTINGLGIEKRTAKVQRIDVGERQIRNGTTFYPLTTEIHVNNRGWRATPLDAGLRQRDGAGKLVDILNDGDNQPVTQPAMLDGAGAAIVNPQPTSAVFGEFRLYPEKPFSSLPGIT